MPYSNKNLRKTLWSGKGDPHGVVAAAKGDRYWAYREQWARTQAFEVVTEYPTQLDIELNPSCNMKCPMCTWSAVETFGPGRSSWMPFERFKAVIDEVAGKVLAVNLNYVNEPLIRKDIPDFVRYAADKGMMDIMFNTNGMLLTREMSRRLIEAGLTKLSVSLDAATEPTYDKIRIGGDFKKVLKNIEDFLDVRAELGATLPLLKVTFVRMKINEAELPGFLDRWRDVADLISVQSPSVPFDTPSDALRRDFIGLPERTEESDKVEVEYEKSGRRCQAPFQRMTIRYNGDTLPCCHFRGVDLVMGNVFQDGVQAVWQSSAMRTLREQQKAGRQENEVCRKCFENAINIAPDPGSIVGQPRKS